MIIFKALRGLNYLKNIYTQLILAFLVFTLASIGCVGVYIIEIIKL